MIRFLLFFIEEDIDKTCVGTPGSEEIFVSTSAVKLQPPVISFGCCEDLRDNSSVVSRSG